MAKLKKLHLGCGRIAPSDWINIDSSWNAWLAKHSFLKRMIRVTGIIRKDLLAIQWPKNVLLHNITKSLPFDNNSIDYIYSSHTLEHLYLNQAKNLLTECLRVLKPAGIIRIVVPDIKTFINEYRLSGTKSSEEWNTKGDILMNQLQLRSPSSNHGNFISRFYNTINDTSSHKWMYDSESLTYWLRWTGFKKIKVKKLFDSKIKNIRNIENPLRFKDAICLEAQKN